MELGLSLGLRTREDQQEEEEVQLTLQPSSHLGFLWSSDKNKSNLCPDSRTGLDVNLMPCSMSEAEDGTARAVSGSPNSTVSSFHMDFAGGGGGEGDGDEDENGSSRKKLRLSKEQSAFLEESFKEHNTLNPKQKVALAKQLNLRPRQVEVWFQNRRARTKLKQTEVDCEYLKRCCETLTEENRRLQKELSELRALKTPGSHPFYMQMPATTLSMCPSCEKTTTTTTSASNANANKNNATSFKSLFSTSTAASKNRFYPFAPHPATSPAS